MYNVAFIHIIKHIIWLFCRFAVSDCWMWW